MVTCAGRDARVGKAAFGGDRGDDRLRAVAAGHRQRVGAALTAPADELSRSSPGSSSIGSIPRARASSASVKRSALPPPECGLKNSTGRYGGGAPGSRVDGERGARAPRATAAARPYSDRRHPPRDEHDRAGERQRATASPATRAAPRRARRTRRAPHHDAGEHRRSPRGNSLTATRPRARRRAPTTSATAASAPRS